MVSPCDSRPDTRGCMLDRAGLSNELYRFSTTALQWEQLDTALVSGSPPSGRTGHAMAAVGSDLFVFGANYYLFELTELFRFSTTARKWEQLDATLVSAVPPSGRSDPAMAAVGSDLFVFGGYRSGLTGDPNPGEEARCACWPPSEWMISHR